MKTSKQIENEIKRLEKQRVKQLEKEELERSKKMYHEIAEYFVKYCFAGNYKIATDKLYSTYRDNEDFKAEMRDIERKRAEAEERRRARSEAKKNSEQNRPEE